MSFDYSIRVSGPLYDGRAEAALHRYTEDLKDTLAKEAYDIIQRRLPKVIRVYTGRYASSIHIDRVQEDRVVTDFPIVYGPWLEGVGSRNFPVTRFRGYHTFRLASQELELKASGIAERLLREKYLREMQ